MEISKSIDWARRLAWAWALVPTWAKLVLIGASSTVLGLAESMPLQAILMMLLGTMAFGMIVIRMVSDAIAEAIRPDVRRQELLDALGAMRLRYIGLERDFIAQNGDEALWNKQTGLHNAAARLLQGELGLDYYSEFKDAKARPIILPAVFPEADFEKLNLLYVIHGRSEWLGATISAIRDGRCQLRQ